MVVGGRDQVTVMQTAVVLPFFVIPGTLGNPAYREMFTNLVSVSGNESNPWPRGSVSAWLREAKARRDASQPEECGLRSSAESLSGCLN